MDGLCFTKMVASGNDFIVIDNRTAGALAHGYSLSDLTKRLCSRKHSVGADGVLFIEASEKWDFKMRIFNPDGSEVDMCGNGSRCVALYAVENGIASKNMCIDTTAGVLNAEVTGLKVKVKLTNPKDVKLNKKLKIDNKTRKIHYLNTGVPHAVLFVNDIDKVNVEKIGSNLRFHRAFKPEGTNVDFVEISGLKEISVRTYERGVESETYACGTGAAASAIVSNLIFDLEPHIDVLTRSGEILRVYFDIKKKKIKDVYLEGEARVVYKGGVSYV